MASIEIVQDYGDKYSVYIDGEHSEFTKVTNPYGTYFMAPSTANYMKCESTMDKWTVYCHREPDLPGRPYSEARMCVKKGITLREALALVLGIDIDE